MRFAPQLDHYRPQSRAPHGIIGSSQQPGCIGRCDQDQWSRVHADLTQSLGMQHRLASPYPQPCDRISYKPCANRGKPGRTRRVFCSAGDNLMQFTAPKTATQCAIDIFMPGRSNAHRGCLARCGQSIDAPLQSGTGVKRIGHDVLIMFLASRLGKAPVRWILAGDFVQADHSPINAGTERTKKNPGRRDLPRFVGAPGTIRTSDPQIRSLVLYPAELRARIGAGPIGTRRTLGNS